MLDLDGIRARLAVLSLGDDIQREASQEYYGDWARLGPLRVLEPDDNDLDVLNALTRVASDIQALLAELDARP